MHCTIKTSHSKHVTHTDTPVRAKYYNSVSRIYTDRSLLLYDIKLSYPTITMQNAITIITRRRQAQYHNCIRTVIFHYTHMCARASTPSTNVLYDTTTTTQVSWLTKSTCCKEFPYSPASAAVKCVLLFYNEVQ